VARIVKQHDERRNEILDAAQALFYSQGYDQTSVQNIINAVGIAKGTFYHYFGSKTALLNEMVERMLHESVHLIEPIVDDAALDALEKFNRFFRAILAWKTENKALMLGILRALYSDENVILRHKLAQAWSKDFEQSLSRIIRQGVAEGLFHTDYPDDVGPIILAITQWLSEASAKVLLQTGEHAGQFPLIERQAAAAQQATERVLGAPAGSLQMIDLEMLRQWFE